VYFCDASTAGVMFVLIWSSAAVWRAPSSAKAHEQSDVAAEVAQSEPLSGVGAGLTRCRCVRLLENRESED